MSAYKFKKFILLLAITLWVGFGVKNIFADTNTGLASIPAISVTLVPNPLTLPATGGNVTYVYKVNNIGAIPLNDVTIVDNKCNAMSGELGDINNNHLLDVNEVWIYNCTTNLKQTTTNTATVTAFANSWKAIDQYSSTVSVAGIMATTILSPTLPNGGKTPNPVPMLPNNGPNPNTFNLTFIIWGVLGVILLILIVVFLLTRKKNE
ncbi:MAG: hypothetical protein P4L63_01075 [Candidatus Pacebacteria bacterium]|nr:hypothetical protein [Candidatus Paceibacterota bacterium]